MTTEIEFAVDRFGNKYDVAEELDNIMNNTKHLTLGTTNDDGWPRATPLKFAYHDGKIVWGSLNYSIHRHNIEHDPRIFISIVNKDKEMNRSICVKTIAHRLPENEVKDAIMALKKWGEFNPDGYTYYFACLGEVDKKKTEAEWHNHYFDNAKELK